MLWSDRTSLVTGSACERHQAPAKDSCCGSSPSSYTKFNSETHYCESDAIIPLDSIDDCDNNPCGDGGVCTDGVRTTAGEPAYTCMCNQGFELVGDSDGLNGFCVRTRQCASSPCQNGAICQETSVYTPGANNYICICESGWEGLQCEIDIDECATNNGFGPCDAANTDRCVNQSPPTEYICVCKTGYEGEHCEQLKQSIPTVTVSFNQNFNDLARNIDFFPTDFINLLSNGWACDPSFNGNGVYTSTSTGDALTYYNGFDWFFSGPDYLYSGLAAEYNTYFGTSTLVAGTASYDVQCISANEATFRFTATYLQDEYLTNRRKRSLQNGSFDFGSAFGSSQVSTTYIVYRRCRRLCSLY